MEGTYEASLNSIDDLQSQKDYIEDSDKKIINIESMSLLELDDENSENFTL